MPCICKTDGLITLRLLKQVKFIPIIKVSAVEGKVTLDENTKWEIRQGLMLKQKAGMASVDRQKGARLEIERESVKQSWNTYLSLERLVNTNNDEAGGQVEEVRRPAEDGTTVIRGWVKWLGGRLRFYKLEHDWGMWKHFKYILGSSPMGKETGGASSWCRRTGLGQTTRQGWYITQTSVNHQQKMQHHLFIQTLQWPFPLISPMIIWYGILT